MAPQARGDCVLGNLSARAAEREGPKARDRCFPHSRDAPAHRRAPRRTALTATCHPVASTMCVFQPPHVAFSRLVMFSTVLLPCFGLGGAGVSVNYAKSPLGPWTTGAASLDPGCKDWSTCGAGQGGRCEPVTQAQQNAVIIIPADASARGATMARVVLCRVRPRKWRCCCRWRWPQRSQRRRGASSSRTTRRSSRLDGQCAATRCA